jgi:hypothetical protein
MVDEGIYGNAERSERAPVDLFGAALSLLSPDIPDGLARLADATPLSPVAFGEWTAVPVRVRGFAARCHACASAHGWTLLQLYSLNRHSLGTNLEDMGSALAMARAGYRALVVDRHGIVESESGAGLRFLPLPVRSDVVLALESMPINRILPRASVGARQRGNT